MPWFARAFLAVALLGASLAPLVVSAEGGEASEAGNIKTFETLKEGYCYDSKYARGAWEFTSKFACNTTGGVLLAKFDCQKSYQTDQGTFCARFKVNNRFKKADAEFMRKELLRKVRVRHDSVIKAKEILIALGYYDGPALFGFDSSFTGAINVFWKSNSTNSLEEPIRTDSMRRRHLSSAVIKALDEASDGYCFSVEQDEALSAVSPASQEGWCTGSESARSAHRSSAAVCTARKGFLLPKDACRTPYGASCKVLSFAGAATFLREAEGEKEVYFANNAKQCTNEDGVLFSKNDCAEKVQTTVLLRKEYCRQIHAETRSSIKARWLAAKAYCYRGESQLGLLAVPRSACTDAGGIVLRRKDCGAFAGTTTRRCLSLSVVGSQRVKAVLASRDGSGNTKVASLPEIDKQAEEEKQRKAEATRIAAEKKHKEQEEKQRQLKLAQAEAEKQKQAEADAAQKQAAKEQHAQQLAASRSRLFEGILKVRTLMQANPDYPQKAGVNETLNLAITRLSLNDLTPLEEAEAMLAGVVRDVSTYEEHQAEKAQRKALAIAKAKKQAEEEKQRKAEATRIAAEKKHKEQEEKQRQLKLAQAEAEKQKQAEADAAQKQAAKEQHAQQLAASRSRLFEGILKVRTLMQANPDYPQKAGVNETLNLAITRLSLNDLTPLEEAEAMLAGVVRDVSTYEEHQAEKAQRKALAIAKAKKQAEEEKQRKAEATRIAAEKKQKEQEEKQRQLKFAQAEAEKQRQAELAALEETKASTTELPPLEPMDRVFVVQQTTNIRTEPKVLAARAGRVASGDTLTILAKVSGQDWYLVETDNGERGYVFAKALASTSGQQGSAAETAKSPPTPKIDFGKYYALVIGNNTYRALPDLHSAVNDARAVAALLESDYGFEVELLTNATRSETYSSLARIRRKVAAKDNLLIYYAGHGWLDKEADEGFWMPVDAEEEDAGNWISSGDIIAAVRRSKAKHVMVVADSCFSGTLTRGLTIKSRTPDYLERMAKKRARTALTSGGLEPVMDSGGGNHSVFAQAFLSVLKENNAVLDGHQLFTVVRKKVMVGSEQTPEYGDLRKAGHDGGDFLFVKR